MNAPGLLLSFFLARAGLSTPLDLDALTPPTVLKERKRPDAKAIKAMVADVVRMVTAMDAIPEFSKSRIESVLGVRLGPSTSDPPDPHGYDAVLQSGPFGAVHFRHSGPGQTAPFWIVGFSVRDDLNLTRQDFDEALVGPRSSSQAHRLPPTTTHSVAGPRRRRLFTFDSSSGALVAVSFLRGAAAKNK
jgi:hypothetical protein